MTTRTESFPLPDLSLKEGETVSEAEYRDGVVVFTIVTEDEVSRSEAGKRFLEISREISDTPIHDGFFESEDPRIRAVLDHNHEGFFQDEETNQASKSAESLKLKSATASSSR